MKKQRMTADNVEQLMEIVRALQTGEDPAVALERKKAESAPQADSPKSSLEEEFPKEKVARKSRKKSVKRHAEPEEETLQMKTEPEISRQSVEEKAEDGYLDQEDEFEENLHEDITPHKFEKPDVNEVLDKVSEGLWKVVQTVDLVIEPLTSWRPKAKEVKKTEMHGNDLQEESVEEVPEETSGKNPEDNPKDNPEDNPAEVPAEVTIEVSAEVAAEVPAEIPTEIPTEIPAEPDDDEEEQKLDLEAEEPQRSKTGIFAKLGDKGIHRRELIMILLVAVLTVAIIVLAVNGVKNYTEQKRKSENVTADKGLTVTVEKEPENWCSQAEIQLRFRTPRVPVTSVAINGIVLQPDAKGYVTFSACDHILEAEAETENGILKAVIEIPKLDSEAPVVFASKVQNQITLTGSDSRSAIKGIRYAVLERTDMIRLPVYQDYTGAIPFESDVQYHFYAIDEAGNISTPIVTNMETAEEIAFSQEEYAVYPGECISTELEVIPEGALLNNLRYESMNPDVISVDSNGAVTALKEGVAAVKVSADGVNSALCKFVIDRTRKVTISAIGDCTLGSDVSFNTTTNLDAYAAMNGYDYFFKNVKAILASDDATFANLEGTLTEGTARAAKTYAFKGDPSYTEILKSGSVEVVTLANNHSNDYGEQSYDDTVRYLEEAGIAWCDGDQISILDVNGVKTAFIGIYVLRDGIAKEEQVKTTVAAAKEAGAQLVIMAFHWGSEKATQPDSTQQSLAHTAIDSGADLVVGHHPHVLQGIEKYNGKYIVYSLANFCFGGNTAPSDKDTMIFQQTFTFTDGELQDNDDIEIVPCNVSSVTDYNNYQPTPASGTEIDRIMSRINEYSAQFGQSYTASDGLK